MGPLLLDTVVGDAFVKTLVENLPGTLVGDRVVENSCRTLALAEHYFGTLL